MQDISGDWEGQSRRNWNNAGHPSICRENPWMRGPERAREPLS